MGAESVLKKGGRDMKVRVKFTKHGALKFIGHLDVMRYFQKAIRRAGIDVAYSAGFSPHQIMSFAAPLGVGLTSDGEYFDIEVNSVTTSEDMKKRLNDTMAEGIEVLEVLALPEHCKNAMASVAAAGYEITFREGCQPDFSLSDAICLFQKQEHVPYLKKTQKSEIELDLKDSVYDIHLISENTIYLLVDASSAGNIKPTMVVEALYREYDLQPGVFDLCIHRTETYLRDEQSETFKPLGSVGQVF